MNSAAKLLEIEAQSRSDAHADLQTPRGFSEDYDLIGLIGEKQFSIESGLPLDLSRKRSGGDGGCDFVAPLRFKIDVKTYRRPLHMICPEGTASAADIHVLAGYIEADKTAILLGWEFGSRLAQSPVRDFGHGVRNHFIPRDQLRPMTELLARIMRLA